MISGNILADKAVACSNCLKSYTLSEGNNCCPECGAIGFCQINSVSDMSCKDHKESPTFDSVKKVKHYQIFPEYDVEARHIIARCINLSGLQGDQAYHYGNALKYLLRLGRKGGLAEDASKCQEYLEYLKE